MVFRLQVENTSLVNSLHETSNNLMQSRREKQDLEEFIQRQTETTDKIVSRLKDTMTNLIENQKVVNHAHLRFSGITTMHRT